ALTEGNREEAARMLGIGERTLYRMIQDWKLWDRIKQALAEADGDVARAARALEMNEGEGRDKMKKWGLQAGEKEARAQEQGSPAYAAEPIKVYEGLDHIRARPGMYIGDTGQGGLHHLVEELLSNSLNEVFAGFCTLIAVELLPDGACRVSDDGRGISV